MIQERKKHLEIKEIKKVVDDKEREEIEMMLAMGLPVGFDSTHDKQVHDSLSILFRFSEWKF